MKIAISPCPNDTFIFEHLAHDLLRDDGEVLFLDIAELNALAGAGQGPELVKTSCASAPLFLDAYRLLPAGGAFSEAIGPLVLERPEPRGDATALPGPRTSAHILWRLWLDATGLPVPPETFLRFDRIPAAVAEGEVRSGVVIHESRFTYHELGLRERVDLGRFWDERTGLPVPLGCVLVRRDLGDEGALATLERVRASLDSARSRPDVLSNWISGHAAEMSPEVQRQHIAAYVTDRSRDCGEAGLQALERLWDEGERFFGPWPVDRSARGRALDEARALRRLLPA